MPTLIASGTRPRPARRGRARAGLPPPARRSLLERLLRRRVRLRVLGTHRQAGEAEPAQHLADRALVQPDREPRLEQGPEIDPAPAHHAVAVRIGALFDGRRQLGLLLGRETRPAPRPGPVAQARETLGVVTVDPVGQGLPVHAGRPRRLLPRGPLQHQRQGEHPPRRPRVPAPRRLAPQAARVQLAPRDRDRHPRPPVSASNHRPTRAGATRLRARQHVRNSGRWYKGLEDCNHRGPSPLDIRTLQRSGPLPLAFLRGVGLPENLIDYLPSLLNQAIQLYSCFISYSSRDQAFADRLHADLQNKGVRCWFAPHDLPIGAKTWDAIDEAIRLRDKVLLILSEHAIASDWVEDEVTKAFAEERRRGQLVLFPVQLDDAVFDTGEAWAGKLRDNRHIGDFRRW